MLEKDFEYYLLNKAELLKQFGNSFVVIQNEKIMQSLPTFKAALNFVNAQKGDFLVQEVNELPDAATSMLSLK